MEVHRPPYKELHALALNHEVDVFSQLEVEGITPPCRLLIGLYPHHMISPTYCHITLPSPTYWHSTRPAPTHSPPCTRSSSTYCRHVVPCPAPPIVTILSHPLPRYCQALPVASLVPRPLFVYYKQWNNGSGNSLVISLTTQYPVQSHPLPPNSKSKTSSLISRLLPAAFRHLRRGLGNEATKWVFEPTHSVWVVHALAPYMLSE